MKGGYDYINEIVFQLFSQFEHYSRCAKPQMGNKLAGFDLYPTKLVLIISRHVLPHSNSSTSQQKTIITCTSRF